MPSSQSERDAMRRALTLAATPGFALGGNPRVGCVLIDRSGAVIAEGYHRGAGTPHAEADALVRAQYRAAGATAVVTLEPCNHTGRTGPCAQGLIDAGVARVVFAQSDPNALAAGGAERLRAAGIDVKSGLLAAEATELNRAWTFATTHGRPFVTWKFAATLDGRSAAVDGTSRWITNPAARADVHRLRGLADTILVGTATVLADDPALTVRDADGLPVALQPLRAVMGLSEIRPDAHVLDSVAATVLLRTRDPRLGLTELFEQGARHVFLEGGPRLAASFVRAGLVDEVVAYLAPALLGAGPSSVADLGISTIDAAQRLVVRDVALLGEGPDVNVRITGSLAHQTLARQSSADHSQSVTTPAAAQPERD